MPHIDFLLSNNRHHAAMMKPVVERLAKRPRYACRILSLCEFRGTSSPVEEFNLPGVEVVRVVPFDFRSPSTGQWQSSDDELPATRPLSRSASWKFFLFWRFSFYWLKKPDLVVTPNDGAFPYDEIARLLRKKDIPFLLVQEGIKFRYTQYGTGGATAAALWGEGSVPFFRHQGIPAERIHLTGNPRFDEIATKDWRQEVEKIEAGQYYDKQVLLFLSNPIDDLGYCSTKEKMDLVRRFIEGIEPLFNDPDFNLILKLHGRESINDFQSLASSFHFSDRIAVMSKEPLYPLFTFADAAVMFASSAGLEALLFDVPLGVLELPRTGFLHDFVEKGAAKGITWEDSIADQVAALVAEKGGLSERAKAYRSHVIAVRENSAERIVKLIDELIQAPDYSVS